MMRLAWVVPALFLGGCHLVFSHSGDAPSTVPREAGPFDHLLGLERGQDRGRDQARPGLDARLDSAIDSRQPDQLLPDTARDSAKLDGRDGARPADGGACSNDTDCTTVCSTGSCSGGVCTNTSVTAGHCLVGGLCHATGPAGSCKVCEPGFSQRALAPAAGCMVSLAGSGATAPSGVGLPPLDLDAAAFNGIARVAILGSELVVSDENNHLIRRIDLKAGKVTTLAGTGNALPFTGGAVALATFSHPTGLAVDSGKVLVADTLNHRIRRIESGNVLTIAGTGVPGSLDGPIASAQLNTPVGIAGTGAMLYVADRFSHRIRQVTAGAVGTFAGSGVPGFLNGPASTARFQEPRGLARDPGPAVLYVADSQNHLIRAISSTGAVTTHAGSGANGSADGPLLSASFNLPVDLAIAPLAGGTKLFVAEQGGKRIRTLDGTKVSTLVSSSTVCAEGTTGTGGTARVSVPSGLAYDPNRSYLYVADPGCERLWAINVK